MSARPAYAVRARCLGKHHRYTSATLTPKAKTIGADGKVTDGAFAAATGYTLIKADSLDNAVEIAKGCPVLIGGARVAVYETFDAMAAMAGSKS